MLEKFTRFIAKDCQVERPAKILVAVSGGMDSVVLLHLIRHAGFPCAVAHCNFSLRGSDSDADEAFTSELASAEHLPFFVTRFDTTAFAKLQGISLQMAARELRYRWFEEIRANKGYDLVATAHHLDDQIETFFINLLRGTGIAGLHGISPRQGNLIRPLLFARREEIESFVRLHGLNFRHDHSNDKLTYQRNQIRHKLIPVIRELQPGYADSITGTIRKLRASETLAREYIEQIRKDLIHYDNDRILIHLGRFKSYLLNPEIAWEILRPFGFHEQVVEDLLSHLNDTSGKQFISEQYRLIKDRDYLILVKHVAEPQPAGRFINPSEEEISLSASERLAFNSFEKPADFRIPADDCIATLDAGKITFPLHVRRWAPGDRFVPLGMSRKKKVSDLLTDLKIPRDRKEQVQVLTSGEEIVWVIGYRISHHFRVTTRTKHILQIKYVRNAHAVQA